MTNERKNEIWQELPTDFKEQLCYDYEQANVALLQEPKNVRIDAHIRFLEEYFGQHNLTAQAEEKTVPLFNINDTVQDVNGFESEETVKLTSREWQGQYWYDVSNDHYLNLCPERDLKRYITDNNKSEEKPKEPRFNIGEKVRINGYSSGEAWGALMHNKIVTIQDYYVKDGVNMYVLKEGCRDFGEHCLEPYNEPKEEEIRKERVKSEKFPIDYAQYRLDLAKEIAVALIEINKLSWIEIGRDAVNLANEIVKRLKETEE